MIELLSEYEANGSGLLMKHRDHYSHSVYVFPWVLQRSYPVLHSGWLIKTIELTAILIMTMKRLVTF